MPDLKGRTFPELDRVVIEGKDMIASARHSEGTVELQKGYDWTGDGQILFDPSSANAFLEVSFQITDPEMSGLVLRLTHAPDYGRYRILLDGEDVTALKDYPDWNPQGPRDLYARGVEVRDYYLGSYTLAPGGHTLRFESAGASPFSTGDLIGLDSVRLRERWHKKRASLRAAAVR